MTEVSETLSKDEQIILYKLLGSLTIGEMMAFNMSADDISTLFSLWGRLKKLYLLRGETKAEKSEEEREEWLKQQLWKERR